ncbi:hypothetical protein AB1Y20_022648 [Prymnesium parvum]|uniref:G-patch domain-containing protein n=1 Tax=Prymnesium parvum TaxID=97485 RepID=A0AB34JK86_PRYPA
MGSGEAKRFRDLYSSAGRHGDSFWKEEKDNVGMKLLKSMGWETGMGLGKDGNGRTTAVKQFRKKDNAGIGAGAATRDEAYRASQDLFNDVLSRLSGKGESEDSAQLGSGATTVKGMVAKRQLVRRFVPGGTAKTASDMAAILGKSASITPALAAFPSMPEISAEENATSKPDEGLHTSSVSLNDYFARRRQAVGLPASVGPKAAEYKGFTLEDQAMFAESQIELAYSGRRGLGLGSTCDEVPDRPAPMPTKPHPYWQQNNVTFAPPGASAVKGKLSAERSAAEEAHPPDVEDSAKRKRAKKERRKEKTGKKNKEKKRKSNLPELNDARIENEECAKKRKHSKEISKESSGTAKAKETKKSPKGDEMNAKKKKQRQGELEGGKVGNDRGGHSNEEKKGRTAKEGALVPVELQVNKDGTGAKLKGRKDKGSKK